jgi:hypothetical protein
MKSIKLSDKYTIYKDKYSGKHSFDEFLKYVELNYKLSLNNKTNTVDMEIHAECFRDVVSHIKNRIEEITGKKFENYAQHSWIYTQKKGFDMEWMHQHLQVYPPNRSTIVTDFTFTFYIQTTDEITGDQGCVVFEDENKKRHNFFPQLGDIFIFPGDIRHTAVPTPDSEKKRIVYAGSLCIDVWNQKINKRPSI